MKSPILRLVTSQGDELGRLPLPEVHLPEAGASGNAPVRPHLTEQMETLYSRIVEAVLAEQMEVALSPIEMQITVSRILLASNDLEEVLIDLPVRQVLPIPTEPEKAEPTGITVSNTLWNDLWHLEETE